MSAPAIQAAKIAASGAIAAAVVAGLLLWFQPIASSAAKRAGFAILIFAILIYVAIMLRSALLPAPMTRQQFFNKQPDEMLFS
jgi:hypothetical protein